MTLRHFTFSLFSALLLPAITLATDSPLFISEVQIAGIKADDEFIRLSNATESIIDLTGFRLTKKSFSGETCKESVLISEKGFIGTIGPKGTFVIAHPSYKETHSANLTYSSASYYITDNTALFLYDKNKHLIDRKAIGNTCDSEIPSPEPTPEPPASPTPSTHASIRINELLPNPSGKDEGEEWVELFNFGSSATDLTGWMLITASGESAKLEKKLPENSFLSISIPLRNTTDTVSLLDPSKAVVSEISYKKAPDGNSLNFSKQGDYRWSNRITREAENILNKPPETKKADIPDTAYLDIPVSFSASGRDDDNEKIKYTWDFGDGHKSYKQKTTHRYEQKGRYHGTLNISDGTENTITEFSLEVKKYEAPKIRMISLIPNPKGKDTDTESIEIENRSKKSVDLLGWSVATGWRKLVNHPIRESFVIEGKSKRFLTRDNSSFTLPNEKGKIELRSPDGETVQKMKYNLKGKSAEEDAKIMKEKGRKWTWIEPHKTIIIEHGTSEEPKTQSVRRETLEEIRLKQDTETITLKKERGEKLVSTEKNPREEMRRLIGFGTDIETPLAILEDTPRVAGTSDDISPKDTSAPADATLDFNAIMNEWLANE